MKYCERQACDFMVSGGLFPLVNDTGGTVALAYTEAVAKVIADSVNNCSVLQAQRDELLAACEAAVDAMAIDQGNAEQIGVGRVYRLCVAAVAKYKGEAK